MHNNTYCPFTHALYAGHSPDYNWRGCMCEGKCQNIRGPAEFRKSEWAWCWRVSGVYLYGWYDTGSTECSFFVPFCFPHISDMSKLTKYWNRRKKIQHHRVGKIGTTTDTLINGFSFYWCFTCCNHLTASLRPVSRCSQCLKWAGHLVGTYY